MKILFDYSIFVIILFLTYPHSTNCQNSIDKNIRQDDFMLIAHRGASGYAPENTIPALLKAMELGANYLEIDVHQSIDSQIVVIHDYDIDRTTNGTGSVKEMNIAELKQFDAGSWFDPLFAGTRIPTLQEVLNILEPNVKLIIEVKGNSEDYPGIEQNIISIVSQYQVESQIILKSFSIDVLNRFKILAPEIPRLYVFVLHLSALNFTIDKWINFTDIYENLSEAQYFQAHCWFINKSVIENAHANSIKIIAWHVNTEEEVESMLELGVDGIETDYPDRVLPYLK